MNNTQFWIYLLIIAGSTYLVRAIPFVAIQKKINNRFIRSFLEYIPYAVLTVMTIPGIFYATGSMISAIVGLAAAVIIALIKPNLTLVALSSCVVVFLSELFLL